MFVRRQFIMHRKEPWRFSKGWLFKNKKKRVTILVSSIVRETHTTQIEGFVLPKKAVKGVTRRTCSSGRRTKRRRGHMVLHWNWPSGPFAVSWKDYTLISIPLTYTLLTLFYASETREKPIMSLAEIALPLPGEQTLSFHSGKIIRQNIFLYIN